MSYLNSRTTEEYPCDATEEQDHRRESKLCSTYTKGHNQDMHYAIFKEGQIKNKTIKVFKTVSQPTA